MPAGLVGLLPGGPAALLTGMQIQQTQVWQGHLPPPEAIERYEALLPGAFDRLLKMAEKQQDGQIRNIEQAQLFTRDDTRWGQVLGAVISAFAMAGAVWCVHEKQPYVAALFLGVPVLAVAKALIESGVPAILTNKITKKTTPATAPAAEAS
jgi:uncharacterized membrane protein